jgi:hypothetical protein
MLLVGLVFGRWWRVVIPAGTVGWGVTARSDRYRF